MWEKLKDLWCTIDCIPSTLKSIIIFIIAVLFFYSGTKYITTNAISEVFNTVKENRRESEDYTKSIAPKINESLNNILNSDTNISNVLLINYHNSTESINGLSYLYMTTLAEAYADTSIKKEWREVYYIDYASELDKIHRTTSTVINTSTANRFPLLSKRLTYCGATYSVWFTLKGVNSEIGVLVIVYKNIPPTDILYYSKNILGCVNRLSILLDYENRDANK